jgi:hypothetical protein
MVQRVGARSHALVGGLGLAVSTLACAALVACGDDTMVTDSGLPDARDAGPDAVVGVTVIPPAPPDFLPCPPGWREVAAVAGAPAYCEPYAPTGHADCPIDEAHFPGTPGCAPIGDACPSDGWPTGLGATNVVYVRHDAEAGGDGTRSAPFTNLSEAIALVPDDGTVAVAPGTYDGRIVVEKPLTILGACTDVVITSAVPSATVELVFAGDVTLRNVRLSAINNGIFVRGSNLTLEGVVIDQVGDIGLTLFSATLTARRLRFDRVTDAMDFALGSTGQLDELAITGLARDAVRTSDSEATIRDAVMARSGEGVFYYGDSDGGVLFERAAFLGGGGALATGPLRVEIRDSVFLGRPVDELIAAPDAIAVFEGGTLILDRVRIERARALGIAIADEGATLTVTDTSIRDTLGTGDGIGHALEVGFGAQATVDRLYVQGAHAVGILATEVSTVLIARDVTVLDTQPGASGDLGRAFQVQTGARVEGERLFASGNHEVAIVSATVGSVFTATDLTIAGTEPRTCAGCPAAGIGIGAYLGASVTLSRFHLTNNSLLGLQLAQDGSADLSDGVISGHPVGVNIQVPDYDIDRLTRGVVFRDNETNLDSTELPVPSPTTER